MRPSVELTRTRLVINCLVPLAGVIGAITQARAQPPIRAADGRIKRVTGFFGAAPVVKP